MAVAIGVGIAAGHWTSIDLWYDMKEGLIAFLGFLAAALVQVMPMTANFLQSDHLTPEEAQRLSASLTRQQKYWAGLLFAVIATMVIVIIGAALKGRIPDGLKEAVCFSIAGSVTFVFIKMLGLFDGIMSLHSLRSELVVSAAKRAAAEKAQVIQNELQPIHSVVPTDYGSIIHRH